MQRTQELVTVQDTRPLLQKKEIAKANILYINNTFKIAETVEHLHTMMVQVTKKEFTPDTVHAACHVVAKLNETLNTVMNAARVLNDD